MAAGALLFAASTASAQPWEQVLPVAQRFVILPGFNNAAVKDNETGLVWERAPDTGVRNYDSARAYCVNKPIGGRKGWRLPSIPEFASLIDPSVGSPSLPVGHPFLGVTGVTFRGASGRAAMDGCPSGRGRLTIRAPLTKCGGKRLSDSKRRAYQTSQASPSRYSGGSPEGHVTPRGSQVERTGTRNRSTGDSDQASAIAPSSSDATRAVRRVPPASRARWCRRAMQTTGTKEPRAQRTGVLRRSLPAPWRRATW